MADAHQEALQQTSLEEAKTVNYQRLGEIIGENCNINEIAFYCNVSVPTSYSIAAGKCPDNPKLSIAVGLICLAKAKKLEIPTHG